MIARAQDVFDRLEAALAAPEARTHDLLVGLRREVDAITPLHWIALHRAEELRAGCSTAIYRATNGRE